MRITELLQDATIDLGAVSYTHLEYPPTEEILKDIEELEVEIHKNLVELRQMLEENDDQQIEKFEFVF